MLELDSGEPAFELDARHVSHHVEDVYLDDDGFMWIEVTFTDTDLGRLVALMPDLVEPTVVAIGFCGWEPQDNVVREASLIHFNLVWKKDRMTRAGVDPAL